MPTHTISGKAVLIAFGLCAVGDFVWGYFSGHTLGAALTAVFLGVFGTAFYLFWFTRQPGP